MKLWINSSKQGGYNKLAVVVSRSHQGRAVQMIALASNDLIKICIPSYKERTRVNKWQNLDLSAVQWKQSQQDVEVSSTRN